MPLSTAELTEQLAVLERKNRDLESIVVASAQLTSSLEFDDIIRGTALLVRDLLDCERTSVFCVDREKGELWSRVAQDLEIGEIRQPMTSGISGHVASTGETVNVPDAYQVPFFNSEFDKRTGFVTRSVLCVPVRDNEQEIIGVIMALNKKSGLFTAADEEYLKALAVHVAIALQNAEYHRHELLNQIIQRDLETAASIQQGLLPDEPPCVPGLEMSAFNLPARQVGGDYYDFVRCRDRELCFTIGDISGKGLPAALLMSAIQAGLRSVIPDRPGVSQVVARLNNLLCEIGPSDKFSTLFMGLIDPRGRTITYTNAGHSPPLLVRGGRVQALADGGGIPLGIVPGMAYQSAEIALEPGDLLVCYTDGITEAMNERREMFGEERLEEACRRYAECGAAEFIDRVYEQVLEFTGDTAQHDDITMLAVKVV